MTEVTQIVEAETALLERELEEDATASDGLKLTGLEILAFIAVKVAIPIVCSFVSRELWERYERIRTHSQAQEARSELAQVQISASPGIDEDIVLAAVVESLVAEGVSPGDASRIALKSYKRLQAQLAPVH
jgi:hypothetical protein